jgi:hypothetical protein
MLERKASQGEKLAFFQLNYSRSFSNLNITETAACELGPKRASLRIQDSSTDYRLPHLLIGYSSGTRQVGLKTDTKICGRNVVTESVSDKFSLPVCVHVWRSPHGRKGRPGKRVFVSRHTRRTHFIIDLAAGETKLGVSGGNER